MNLEAILETVQSLEDYKKYNRLEFYQPYEFQKRFHNAKGLNTDIPAITRALMAGNQIGKTRCGCSEDAYHLTGLYPEWWEGTKFTRPVTGMIAGKTNDSTTRVLQKELFGDPLDKDQFGTGTVPKDLIGDISRKPGVPNAYAEVLVKHYTNGRHDGFSKCFLMSYEMKAKAFMGYKIDFGHCDEEPPKDIWDQFNRAVLATNGILYITFTPEEGITQVVDGFMSEPKNGSCLVQASWDDAPHMTREMREINLKRYPEHEREMRSKGIPQLGSGLVFSVAIENIRCDPFEIPAHWPKINGVDFGWDHPFACSFIAWDREHDAIYVYDGYKEKRALPAMHADAIRRRGDWIPIAWPKDGLQTEKGSGKSLADKYRNPPPEGQGLNFHHTYFTNPPSPGEQEGKGTFSVEVGILEMLEMMETGRFKVFKTVNPFWEELGMYHRKNGQIVPFNDDFMSATRYAVMFRRHAEVKVMRQPKQQTRQGIRNW